MMLPPHPLNDLSAYAEDDEPRGRFRATWQERFSECQLYPSKSDQLPVSAEEQTLILPFAVTLPRFGDSQRNSQCRESEGSLHDDQGARDEPPDEPGRTPGSDVLLSFP